MAPPDDDDAPPPGPVDEPTAKQLVERRAGLDQIVDAATRAELERWFSLPSFSDAPKAPEPPKPPTRSEQAAQQIREARAAATAAVDLAFLGEIDARRDKLASARPPPTPPRMWLDDKLGAVDLGMIDRAFVVHDPRLLEIPEELIDELKECTPQALLRDLHRPDEDFPWNFEVVDPLAEWKVDLRAVLKAALTRPTTMPKAGPTPLDEARAMFVTLRELRQIAVADIPFKRRTVKD